jgi:hypothetical protein
MEIAMTRINPLHVRPTLDRAYVYGIKSGDLTKIGVAKDIAKRLDTIRGHNPHGCDLVWKRLTVAPFHFEKKMHELLAEHAIGREWFRVTLEQIKGAATLAHRHAQDVMLNWELYAHDVHMKRLEAIDRRFP